METIFPKVQILFRIICLIITLVLFGICLHKFIWDEDVSKIHFREYHKDKHSVYPALTLCLMNENIFDVENMFRDVNFSSSSYSSFLKGDLWDDKMNSVEYDDLTKTLDDYVEGIGISSSKNQTVYYHCSDNFQRILNGLLSYECEDTGKVSEQVYSSFKNHHSKCLSFTIPYDKDNMVLKLRILLKTSIFVKNHTTDEFENQESFGVFVHYPQQLFRSPIRRFYHKSKNDSNLHAINFKINNMEVYRRRNKPKNPCNDEWNDDMKILESIVNLIGCQPPHWNLNRKLGRCTTQDQIKAYNLPLIYWIPRVPYLNFLKHLPPPCSTILDITNEYSETQWNKEEFSGLDANLDLFEVNLEFSNPTYKEITQVKAYDEESFVGNVGGYIGMFLGISLLQLPELMNIVYKKTKDAKEEVSNAIRKNFEAGVCLVNNNISSSESQNQSMPSGRSKVACSFIEDVDLQLLHRKIRILEEKIDKIANVQAVMQSDSRNNYMKKEKFDDEILM